MHGVTMKFNNPGIYKKTIDIMTQIASQESSVLHNVLIAVKYSRQFINPLITKIIPHYTRI